MGVSSHFIKHYWSRFIIFEFILFQTEEMKKNTKSNHLFQYQVDTPNMFIRDITYSIMLIVLWIW